MIELKTLKRDNVRPGLFSYSSANKEKKCNEERAVKQKSSGASYLNFELLEVREKH